MRIFKSVVASLLFLSLITGPAAAQKGRTGTDKSQAALTIQVNVAPVILTPKQGAQAQDQFHIPSRSQPFGTA
jgi:hypothetical protein